MEEKLQTLCLDLRCGNITSKVFIKELFSIYNVKSLHDLKPLLKQDDSEVFMILETILLQSEKPVLNNEDIEGEDEGHFES